MNQNNETSNNPNNENKKEYTKKSFIKDMIETIITALIIFGIIQTFFILSNVNQTSMYPTFKDGDFIIATRGYLQKNTYDYEDIILFKHENRVLIKRIIGKPGDKILISNGEVYVNDKILNEEYGAKIEYTFGELELIVPENEYFVLGDNRDNSLDSRNIGTVKQKYILGKVRIRIFPETKIFK